jgi:hypothetical protein
VPEIASAPKPTNCANARSILNRTTTQRRRDRYRPNSGASFQDESPTFSFQTALGSGDETAGSILPACNLDRTLSVESTWFSILPTLIKSKVGVVRSFAVGQIHRQTFLLAALLSSV